jgi:hypothetical protein
MPIRPENKHKYPWNWDSISRRIRVERAGNRCETCGVENGAVGARDKDGAWHDEAAIHGMNNDMGQAAFLLGFPKMIKIVLTVAHLDHNPANCDGMERGLPMLPKEKSNLRAWCQKCHNGYDAKTRHAGIGERAAKDQMKLF